MADRKHPKSRVRARMAHTGERDATARLTTALKYELAGRIEAIAVAERETLTTLAPVLAEVGAAPEIASWE